jgi:hypothetical protein
MGGFMFLPIPKIDYHAIWNIDENALRPTWKKPSAYSINVGDPVGWVQHNPKTGYIYCRVKIDGKSYSLGRIMYYIFYGKDPEQMEVDHLNGDAKDNRKCNINPELVTQLRNGKNLKKFKNNTSGITGIYIKHPVGRMKNISYTAYIWHNKKMHTFTSIDFFEALCWRKSMENKIGVTKARKHRQD